MITTDILQAFIQRLDDFDWSPALPVIWPSTQDDPPGTGQWLEATFFPNEPFDMAWEDDSCHELRGFFQVSVGFRPTIRGQLDSSEIADALIAHFPKGLVIGPVRVRKRAWQSPAIVEDASTLFIPVTIPFLGIA